MSIFKKLLGGNILYYPGCLTKFVAKDLEENYKKILTRIGIDFIQLKNLELCCGSPVLNAGYKKDFENLMNKNLEVFKEHSINKIITSCPACFKTFSQTYRELKGWDIEVEHTTVTIWKSIEKGKLKINRKFNEKITYHDPCHLGRHSKIYDEPRNILKALGFEIVEMRNSRENALCCGAGAGLKTNQPDLANKIAVRRLQQAEDKNIKKMITCCALCYAHLKENSKGVIEVFELSQVLKDAI